MSNLNMTEIKSEYNYPEIIAWLEKKGLEVYGPHFRIVDSDYLLIHRLIAYFIEDNKSALQLGLNLSKGILLVGPVGCGKTSLMNLMRYLARPEGKFILKPCRDIGYEFINDGYEVIQKYGQDTRIRQGQRVTARYCFDDLGIENNLKYYGNSCNVMAEVMLSRYDIFINKKITTHITTNLSASEIEQHYGVRVRSRLREMMNLIAFENNAKDKR